MKTISSSSYANQSVHLATEPTFLDRVEQNSRTVGQLRGLDLDVADALADTIDGCRPLAPCFNAACLVCGSSVQKPFIESAQSLWPAGTPLAHITIMPALPKRAIGSLDTVDMQDVEQHLRYLLKVAGYAILNAIAFIDLCHSVDRRSNQEAWYPHYHMVAGAADTTDLTDRLRNVLAPTPDVRRPVMRVKLNEPARQLHYISKPRPARVTRFDEASKSIHPLKQWLKAREHIEATLWLGRYSVMDRFVALPGPSDLLRLQLARRT